MTKVRIDAYIDRDNFLRLMEFQAENNLKTPSRAVNSLITSFFKAKMRQDEAVDRLNSVIQGYENKVTNLKSEIEHIKISKRRKKNENKTKKRKKKSIS